MKLLLNTTLVLILLPLFLYSLKSEIGIDLVSGCHAWEILSGQCSD
jgi:hypothetical protein